DVDPLLDVLELQIPVGMVGPGEPLDVDPGRVGLGTQESGHGRGTGRMTKLRQSLAEGLQTRANELGLPHGVTTSQRSDDAQEGRDDLGDFFSSAGRPPPDNRSRSAGRLSRESASSS